MLPYWESNPQRRGRVGGAYALSRNQTPDLLVHGMTLNQLSHSGQGVFFSLYLNNRNKVGGRSLSWGLISINIFILIFILYKYFLTPSVTSLIYGLFRGLFYNLQIHDNFLVVFFSLISTLFALWSWDVIISRYYCFILLLAIILYWCLCPYVFIILFPPFMVETADISGEGRFFSEIPLRIVIFFENYSVGFHCRLA